MYGKQRFYHKERLHGKREKLLWMHNCTHYNTIIEEKELTAKNFPFKHCHSRKELSTDRQYELGLNKFVHVMESSYCNTKMCKQLDTVNRHRKDGIL